MLNSEEPKPKQPSTLMHKIGIVSICLLAAFLIYIMFNLKGCEGTKTTLKPGEYKTIKEAQGDTIRGEAKDSIRVDTIVKWRDSKVVIKRIIIEKHDTTHHYHVANDEMKMGAYTFTISDTVRNDTIDRRVKLVHVDSTHFIVRTDFRVDTVFKSKTDTLVQENKGAYWRGLKHGFLIGGIAGLAAGVYLDK